MACCPFGPLVAIFAGFARLWTTDTLERDATSRFQGCAPQTVQECMDLFAKVDILERYSDKLLSSCIVEDKEMEQITEMRVSVSKWIVSDLDSSLGVHMMVTVQASRAMSHTGLHSAGSASPGPRHSIRLGRKLLPETYTCDPSLGCMRAGPIIDLWLSGSSWGLYLPLFGKGCCFSAFSKINVWVNPWPGLLVSDK